MFHGIKLFESMASDVGTKSFAAERGIIIITIVKSSLKKIYLLTSHLIPEIQKENKLFKNLLIFNYLIENNNISI